jgi:hypothetical protein
LVIKRIKMSFFNNKLEKTHALHFWPFYANGKCEFLGSLDLRRIDANER